jgi:hypothetical protein
MDEQEQPTVLKHWENMIFKDQTVDLDGNSF